MFPYGTYGLQKQNYKILQMDPTILKAIQDNNLVFVSAQPDHIYFHWQVELYLYQFKKHNIQDRCYAIFGYTGQKPSAYVTNLAKQYNIISYKDERTDKSYIPSIRPHILAKFFADRPELGKNVFYHDSDIFIVKMPRFDLMLSDSAGYVSDTVNYIGYNYINSCCKRYKEIHTELADDDIFLKMCELVHIDPTLVQSNEQNSGGAQYLLKHIDSQYWKDVETSCNVLYKLFLDYEKKYPIAHHIQKWTADMWAVLWNYWKRGGTTIVHKELEFSWATGTVNDYFNRNIFHLAGVTTETEKDKFYKAKYTGRNIFEEYIKDNTIFDHVSKHNATYEYISVLKEYVEVYKNGVTKVPETNKNIQRFKLTLKEGESDIFYRDDTKLCCEKPVWRSSKYIIFNNSHSWILTYLQYENEIGEKCGGIGVNAYSEPYGEEWNNGYSIEFI